MKRILSLFLAVILLLAAGCTPQPESALDPQNPVTITLWHYYVGENQQALDEKVATFNQTIGMEEGVVVQAMAMGSIAELEAAITDSATGALNARPMPELFSSYPDKAMEIDALGMVCELNAYFTEKERALYISDFLADGVFDEDRLLLIPIVKSTELLYVNATDWDAFAKERAINELALATWEGVYETARSYYQWQDEKTPAVPWDGKGFIGLDSVANYIIIGNKQQGVHVIDGDDERAVLNKSAMKRLFELYYKGMSLGYFDAVGKFRSDDIKAGDLISYVGSSSSAAYFPTWIEKDNSQQDISFMAKQYPTFEGGVPYAIQQGAGICVAKSTEQKQQGAVMFLKWFTAPEQNIAFSMTTGYLPVQRAAYESDSFEAILEGLRADSRENHNVAAVYDIALQQITEANTYAAQPFPGSYDVRTILQSTLLESAAQGRAIAEPLQQQGREEDEILLALDINTQFETWLADIQSKLDALEIAYIVE